MKLMDLVVLGGGTAGLTAAVGAARVGASTMLIERDRTGGDCLWTGCVPSKSLLAAASRAQQARTAARFGVHVSDVQVDLRQVMEHVRRSIDTLAPHDSAERLRREGVEVVRGTGRFVGPDQIVIDDGPPVRFRHAMIATGAQPIVPPIPGLREVQPLTSDDVWGITDLPERLVVLGGGPIGTELGQAFARLGSRVTVIEMAEGLLPREEPDAGEIVAEALSADGVDVRVRTTAMRVEPSDQGNRLVVECDGRQDHVAFDQILVALGRRPDVSSLGLDEAGVTVDRRGAVVVDRRLRTSSRRILAGGDVTMQLPFTHTAATHGAVVVQNALFGLRRSVDHQRIPWVTFTSPEVARVGLSVEQARDRFGDRARVRTASHADLDRAVTDGETGGFATLVGDPRGRIVGATVVGPRAGETIGEVVAWMAAGARLSTIVRTTHAYPTWSQGLVDASMQELQADLDRVRGLSTAVLRIRRAFSRWR